MKFGAFLGQVLENNEVHFDKSKLEAIKLIPRPTSKTKLQHLMGIANYLVRFVLHMAKLLNPLMSLLLTKKYFVWNALQAQAFADRKKILLSGPVLALYSPDKETRLTTGAPSYGLGAVLQQKQPNGNSSVVGYASRLLTETEWPYGQIEKEGLTLVWD